MKLPNNCSFCIEKREIGSDKDDCHKVVLYWGSGFSKNRSFIPVVISIWLLGFCSSRNLSVRTSTATMKCMWLIFDWLIFKLSCICANDKCSILLVWLGAPSWYPLGPLVGVRTALFNVLDSTRLLETFLRDFGRHWHDSINYCRFFSNTSMMWTSCSITPHMCSIASGLWMSIA